MLKGLKSSHYSCGHQRSLIRITTTLRPKCQIWQYQSNVHISLLNNYTDDNIIFKNTNIIIDTLHISLSNLKTFGQNIVMFKLTITTIILQSYNPIIIQSYNPAIL